VGWTGSLLPILLREDEEKDATTFKVMVRRVCNPHVASVLAQHKTDTVLPLVRAYLTHSDDEVCREGCRFVSKLRMGKRFFLLTHLFQKEHNGPLAPLQAVRRLFRCARLEFVNVLREFMTADAFMLPIDCHHLVISPVVDLLLRPHTDHLYTLVDTCRLTAILNTIFNQRRQHLAASAITDALTNTIIDGFMGAWRWYPTHVTFERQVLSAVMSLCTGADSSPGDIMYPCVRRLLDISDMLNRMESIVRHDDDDDDGALLSTPADDKYRLDMAILLRNRVYGCVERDIRAAMVRYCLGAPGCIILPRPRHVYLAPSWFDVRMAELQQRVADAAFAAQLALEEEEEEEEDEEEEEEEDEEDEDEEDGE
jgi:hypothetical protein